MKLNLFVCVATLAISNIALASDFSYEAVADRYRDSALSPDEVKEAKMQGECLVGLKELNFKKKEEFDPIAEWTNYRSISLLEQFPPCEVLIMMEVAKTKIEIMEQGR